MYDCVRVGDRHEIYGFCVKGALPICHPCAPSSSHTILRSAVDEVLKKSDNNSEVMRGPVVHFKDCDNDKVKTMKETIKQFVSRLPASDKEKFERE